jgi:hypothetical protein
MSTGKIAVTESWANIVARYEKYGASSLSISSVGAVARHIHDTRLSAGLFGWTSMHDLCVTQTEVQYPYLGPYLRLRPLSGGEVEFRYIVTQIEKDQWRRTVHGLEALGRFNVFLNDLHWVSVI